MTLKKLGGHAAWAVEARFAELLSDRALAWWWARGERERVFGLLEHREWSVGAPLVAAYGRFFDPNPKAEVARSRAERLAALGDATILRQTGLALGEIEPTESEQLGYFGKVPGLAHGSLLARVALMAHDEVATRSDPGILIEGVARPELVPELLTRVAQAEDNYREGLITSDERAAPELALAVARGNADACVAADVHDALDAAATPAAFDELSAVYRRRLDKLASGDLLQFERWLVHRVSDPATARAIAERHPDPIAKLSNRAASFLALLPGESTRLATELAHDRNAGWHWRSCHVLAGLLRDGAPSDAVASQVLDVPHGCIEPRLVTHLVQAVQDPLLLDEIRGRRTHALDSLRRRVRGWLAQA